MEDVSSEPSELLWHFIAGLFPARIGCMASSKGEAHKGKTSLASCGTHLLNQIQVAFSVYITTPSCSGLVQLKKPKQNTALTHNSFLSTGIDCDFS